MQYPKQLMSISELVLLGYSRDYLKNIVHAPGQKFATLTPGGGKWQIDVEELERYRTRQRGRSGRCG